MKKQIELTTEQAQSLIGKNPEMDELIKANFPELFNPILPKTWEELGLINGYFVASDTAIYLSSNIDTKIPTRPVFATKSQAIAHGIVAAQLSQLMKAYNGDWVADWEDVKQKKYCISRHENELLKNILRIDYNFIALKSAELMDEFFENFENLIKAYYES